MTIPKHARIAVFLLLAFATNAQSQTDSSYQDNEKPIQQLHSFRQMFWDSLPQPVGFVNDYEDIFSAGEEETLDSLIADFEERAAIQIAVITFDTILVAVENLDALTLRIANSWGVGDKEKDNGITIGISRGYRKMRIHNGDGMAKILTDAKTKEIINTGFLPNYRLGKYFEGTLNGLKSLMAIIEQGIADVRLNENPVSDKSNK